MNAKFPELNLFVIWLDSNGYRYPTHLLTLSRFEPEKLNFMVMKVRFRENVFHLSKKKNINKKNKKQKKKQNKKKKTIDNMFYHPFKILFQID